ncbi:glucan endo-1,3-beta-D-glucosidase [Capsicum annuum]|uniref:glucan endo-1,3-beta-D-glucosidase n=1 Tax=Capsicum annuum TaxID=4072 RepID=UPI001FB0C4CD|nr:glucan endo-1,3-beta-D-glucosidase [Capsicum annuum]
MVLFFTSFCQGYRTGNWCVTQWNATDEVLTAYLAKKCKKRSLCTNIRPGKPCYEPNIPHAHASYILNLLFKLRRDPCWDDIGMITHNNPCTDEASQQESSFD